jgi:hypothetical protein
VTFDPVRSCVAGGGVLHAPKGEVGDWVTSTEEAETSHTASCMMSHTTAACAGAGDASRGGAGGGGRDVLRRGGVGASTEEGGAREASHAALRARRLCMSHAHRQCACGEWSWL